MNRAKSICGWIVTLAAMFLFALIMTLALKAKADGIGVTNTVLMVDQNGNLNVSGIASVQDVATNAVNVRIAQTAARAAKSTATEVTNNLNGIVQNIMSNNVVIYRRGFTDAFEGLIVYTTNDTLAICGYTNNGIANGVLSCNIEYVCSADIGVTKPNVMANDTLAGGTANFTQVPSSGVTTPTIHNETRTVGSQTYDKWYEIDVEVSVSGTKNQYFYFLQIDADTPSGDGATLTLVNGVTGGKSTTVTWGDKILTFKGGVLTGVEDVAD